MAQTGERVIAVITSLDNRAFIAAQLPNAATPPDHAGNLLDDARFVARILVVEGFELLNFHPIAMSFAGTPEMFEQVFGICPVRRTFPGGRGHQVEGFDVKPEDRERLSNLPAIFEGRAGRIAIARPPRLIDDAGLPVRDVADTDCPTWLLPDELALSIWADGADAPMATGHGVIAAQIGTGHYRHPFFRDRGYRVLPTLLGPGQKDPQRDDHGHSTGEAACLFGAAPDLKLRPIKGLLDPVGDLLMAVDSTPTPSLIVNSWGYDADQGGWDDLERTDPNLHHYLKILETAIAFATARGVAVCAAAPRTWKSFPACHPDVIAVAAMSNGRGPQQASHGLGASGLYPGRSVPDLWSDAARLVRAGSDLIGCIQPAQPGSVLAQSRLQAAGSDEGFAWCDIEQAAAPLAASRMALLLEQHRGVSPMAFKAMVVAAAGMQEADPLDPALPDLASRAGDVLPQLTGERSA